MKKRVCPWWLGYLLASPLRRLLEDPVATVQPYVRPGMTVLEPGPGMGFYTIELARLVGTNGRVIAVDVQPRMIAGLKRRLERAGLLERVDARVVGPESLALDDLSRAVDFVLAAAVVHETPGAPWFFSQVSETMKPGATLLFFEPSGHVNAADFGNEVDAARAAGLVVVEHPAIRRNRAVLLQKQ